MVRRIGIDFGTSTTVLRVKNYEDDARTPVGANALACDVVKFGGMDTVPTLVREWTEGGARQSACGAKAASDRPGSVLHSGFKMELESPDEDLARRAWALTDEFFRYLYAAYHEDSMNGSFGDSAAREETWVSHPVKWREETARRLVRSAEAAGFKNVHRMNEAQAAVTSVAMRNAGQLQEKLHLAPGDRFRVLLVDMGAGTTDLVLGDYTYAADAADARFQTEVCWPVACRQPEDGAGFTCGGRDFDRLLAQHMQKVLRDSGVPGALPGGVEQVRAWKEKDLSPSLADDMTVRTFAPFDMYQQMTGTAIPFCLDRTAALAVFHQQLCQLIDLVNGCMAQAKEPYVDAVVLVGGGSQWFFVQDLMAGKLDADGKFVFLARRDKTRPVILPVGRPQETVAQGLVLAPLGGVTGEAEKSQADQTPEAVPAGPALVSEDQWQRPEYAACLARYIVDQFNNPKSMFSWKGNTYTERVSALKEPAGRLLALLSQREPVRVCIRHGSNFLTGDLTRADCNAMARKEEYAPPFPDSRGITGCRPLQLYCMFWGSAKLGLEMIRTYEKDYMLTKKQKDLVRDTMRRLGKRTTGMRRRDVVVGDGMDSIPETEKAYKKALPLPEGFSPDSIQVYYCHPHGLSYMVLTQYDILVTDLGLLVLETAPDTAHDSELYSWFEIAMTNCTIVHTDLRKTECGEQLEEAMKEICDKLKKDFGMDYIISF